MKFQHQDYTTITNLKFKDLYPKVHSALNQYYPVGLRASNEKYKNYVGYKALESLLQRKFENPDYIKEKWDNSFLDKIKSITDYRVEGATFGFAPNFGGSIIVNQSGDLRYTTKLDFFVSFLYNFFSIQVVYSDKFVVYKREHLPDKIGSGILKIVVSPVKKEFEELFLKIENLIREEFDNAFFMPFRFDITKIEKFETPSSVSLDFSEPVSSAFFHKGYLLNEGMKILGNLDYKIEPLQL
jgi:hypothetical protein